MRKPVKDKLRWVTLSRQRRYQLRMKRRRRCTQCGAPVAAGSRSLCLEHLIHAREQQRAAQGHARRYTNALSYCLEAAA